MARPTRRAASMLPPVPPRKSFSTVEAEAMVTARSSSMTCA